MLEDAIGARDGPQGSRMKCVEGLHDDAVRVFLFKFRWTHFLSEVGAAAQGSPGTQALWFCGRQVRTVISTAQR